MKILKNSGCGDVRLIEIKNERFWGYVAILQKVVNDEYIVALGYEEPTKDTCRWCQGHYFTSIVNAVEDFKEV